MHKLNQGPSMASGNQGKWGLCLGLLLLGGFGLYGASAPASATKKWTPTKLSAAHKKILFGTKEDRLKKPVCTGKARVTTRCRDKSHYVASNEYYHQFHRPYIEGIGGGHVGVGTEQNFTYMAWSRARFGWLMDYDPVVVRVNLVHRALILLSKNRKAYTNRFSSGKNIGRVARLLSKFYKNHPERKGIVEAYRYARRRIGWQNHLHKKRRWNWNYHRNRKLKKHERLPFTDNRDFSWLHKEEWYQYIRKMFQTNRIRVMKGDLLLASSMRGIGNAAKKVGITIRSLYMSNAEEFWKYPQNFRKNVRNLPMDKRSVILRTRFTSKYGPRLDAWIYIIQGGLDFQKKLGKPAYNHVDKMMKGHKKVFRGVYTINAPKPLLKVAP